MAVDTAEHRPWPVPPSPWVMKQNWHELLFMHWALPPEHIRPLIPAGLDLDVYGGSAWVGVVPFRMSGVRLRGTPALPGLSAFPELNVRTYVNSGGKPGVWFFSLDADNAPAVAAARRLFHLPYFRARMSCLRVNDTVEYRSHRTHRGARAAAFRGKYGPMGPVFRAVPGTVEYFLTERYCLYAASGRKLFRGEINHEPWPLQAATAEIEENTIAESDGIKLPEAKPLLHFAGLQEVNIWPLRRTRGHEIGSV